MVDMVAQNAEQAEVSGHYDQAQYPGHECSQDAEERPNCASAYGDNPGDEGYAAGDWMQDHSAGEAVGGASLDVGKLRTVHAGNDMSGLVPDMAVGAPVW